MKRMMFGIAILAAPAVMAAQAAPAAAIPSPVTEGPAAPAVAKKWELRVGGFMVSGERDAVFNKSVKTTTGSVKGVEVLLRGSGAGIQVRSSASTFDGPPDVINADVSVLLGVPAFTFFVGGAKRAVTSTLGTQVYTFGRVGAQMTFLIGGTGVRGQVGGWAYVPGPDDQARMDLSAEGEASVLWSPQRLPFFVQFGYRNESFKAKTLSTPLPEEIRGLRVGGGFQLGGK